MSPPDDPAAPAARTDAGPVLLRNVDGGVATLTMNRPRQFNAISVAMLDAMQAELDAIGADPAIRVVVIAGAGGAFSGGHDLKEMMGNRTEPFIRDLFERCSRVMLTMQSLPQPVIARVHGIATAAGCQMVAACDLAIASSDARFATSGINYGLFCATPGVPVSRNVSRKRAFEMLFTGEFIDAETARDWGLVNRVGPASGPRRRARSRHRRDHREAARRHRGRQGALLQADGRAARAGLRFGKQSHHPQHAGQRGGRRRRRVHRKEEAALGDLTPHCHPVRRHP
jgi:enoyl-CoA hydratase/carnithine racemase